MPGNEKPCVVVTGFGPFRGHSINASWSAVKELDKLGIGENIQLVVYELPVIYEDVKQTIPQLWQKHNPILMVHVGVSGIAEMITLEQQAHNDGYDRHDVNGCIPSTKLCVDDSCDELIVSEIDMSLVCAAVNDANLKVTAVVSHDPGRYLCDFSYYTSLHQDRKCSAFIHVPPLGSPYTAVEMGEGLQRCIHAMLQQLQT